MIIIFFSGSYCVLKSDYGCFLPSVVFRLNFGVLEENDFPWFFVKSIRVIFVMVRYVWNWGIIRQNAVVPDWEFILNCIGTETSVIISKVLIPLYLAKAIGSVIAILSICKLVAVDVDGWHGLQIHAFHSLQERMFQLILHFLLVTHHQLHFLFVLVTFFLKVRVVFIKFILDFLSFF